MAINFAVLVRDAFLFSREPETLVSNIVYFEPNNLHLAAKVIHKVEEKTVYLI